MDYAAEIERLIRVAETGEQWAEICRLENEMIAAARSDDEAATA